MNRCIYVGMSTTKTWCGKRITEFERDRMIREAGVPLTEGEYIDGFAFGECCDACVEAITPVRGLPVGREENQ